MKKRLLITSIVMMLVCAVALSTATYAWFTSNQSVQASTMTLRAAVSDAAALGIGWTNSPAKSSIVSDIYNQLNPMAPEARNDSNVVVALANNQAYEYLAGGNLAFYNSTVKEEAGVIKFNGNGRNEEPVVYTESANKAVADDANSVRSFYVRNLSKANTISSLTVTAVFPGSENGVQYRVTTDATPQSGTQYFVLVNGVYKNVTDSTAPNYDSDYAITNAFDDDVTYYVVAGPFVPTKDKDLNNVDVIYYDFDSTRDAGSQYQPVSRSDIDINANAVITKHGASGAAATLYEELKGNDMIRVALFTKEYRQTTDDNTNTSKVYYWYNPTTNVIEAKVFETSKVVKDLGYELFELKAANQKYKSSTDNEVDQNKTYYTYDSSNDVYERVSDPQDANIASYFELVPTHNLLGVLAQNATTYTKASTPFDKNEVYYTVNFSADNTVTTANYTNKVNAGLYVLDNDNYVPASGAFNNATTYYTAASTLVNNPDPASIGTYYTASYTVANGQIQTNGAVNKLNYYTGVTADITFAETLKPGEQVDIIAVIWLDGTDLDDTRANQLAQVSLLFETNATSNN